MFRNKILFVVFVFMVVLGVFVYLAIDEAKQLPRDTAVLLHKYYFLRHKNEKAAKAALEIILQQEQNNRIALQELSRLYLKEGQLKKALPLIIRLTQLEENNERYQLDAAQIYYEIGKWHTAQKILFSSLQSSTDPAIRHQALYLLQLMKSYIPHLKAKAQVTRFIFPPKIKSASLFLDHYYKLGQRDDASGLLTLAFYLDPDNPLILQEKGYLALSRKQPEQARCFFLGAYQQRPSPELALQIAYLYLAEQNEQAAKQFFLLATHALDAKTRLAASRSLDYMAAGAYFKRHQLAAISRTVDVESGLMNQFYQLKKMNQRLAWRLILKIIAQYPTNTEALKEAGFLALDLHYRKPAILFFSRAYHLTRAPELAMQLGFLHDIEGDKPRAYQYFELATKSLDQALALQAENALVNLRGLQTKALPDPYFGEVFFTPFSQSRFGLTVRPLIARLGLELDDRLRTKTYLAFRQTDDNKSSNAGELPQIFEDNVRIIGTGIQISPFKTFPLVGWVEAGNAYDLVFRNRNRWRGDLRGGLMYYDEFGKKTAYYDHLRIKPDYYGMFYGDITYFSRYDNNVIGTFDTRQGFHVLQYHNTLVNLYLYGRVIQDSRREFFNNIAEAGPGLGIIPYNRFNLELRMEWIRGVYLPAGGSVNPYGKYYNNGLIQLLYYVKI